MAPQSFSLRTLHRELYTYVRDRASKALATAGLVSFLFIDTDLLVTGGAGMTMVAAASQGSWFAAQTAAQATAPVAAKAWWAATMAGSALAAVPGANMAWRAATLPFRAVWQATAVQRRGMVSALLFTLLMRGMAHMPLVTALKQKLAGGASAIANYLLSQPLSQAFLTAIGWGVWSLLGVSWKALCAATCVLRFLVPVEWTRRLHTWAGKQGIDADTFVVAVHTALHFVLATTLQVVLELPITYATSLAGKATTVVLFDGVDAAARFAEQEQHIRRAEHFRQLHVAEGSPEALAGLKASMETLARMRIAAEAGFAGDLQPSGADGTPRRSVDVTNPFLEEWGSSLQTRTSMAERYLDELLHSNSRHVRNEATDWLLSRGYFYPDIPDGVTLMSEVNIVSVVGNLARGKVGQGAADLGAIVVDDVQQALSAVWASIASLHRPPGGWRNSSRRVLLLWQTRRKCRRLPLQPHLQPQSQELTQERTQELAQELTQAPTTVVPRHLVHHTRPPLAWRWRIYLWSKTRQSKQHTRR